jgi:hypothetical protein
MKSLQKPTQLITLHSTQKHYVSTNANFTSIERILNLPLSEVGSWFIVAKLIANKKTGIRTAVIYLHRITPILYHAPQVSVCKFRIFYWLGKSASGHRTESGFVAAADVLCVNGAIIFPLADIFCLFPLAGSPSRTFRCPFLSCFTIACRYQRVVIAANLSSFLHKRSCEQRSNISQLHWLPHRTTYGFISEFVGPKQSLCLRFIAHFL